MLTRSERTVANGVAALLIATLTLVPEGREAETGHAEAAAPEIQLHPVVSSLTSPLLVTSAGDGSDRLFIVEQAGLIKVLEPGATTPAVFLDLSAKVMTGDQQGLLALAFHPQYSSNRRFFVDYTRASDSATVVAEYRVSATDANVADPAETILLVIPEPLPNVTGGTLAFGPDGFLYIGVGIAGVDNDPANTAQDLNGLLGKILRIDVDHPAGGLPYSSPPDNPFVGATAGRDEIFAYGLRNPWRFSFDRLTGDLFAGDVGNRLREEVNRITRSGNYGWRVREGLICSGNDPLSCDAPGFVPPLADYEHTGGRCAVIGGHVYRGTRGSLPAGSYVFGDFCSGEIFVLQDGAMRLLLATSLIISSFGEDQAGEL
jgi:glucose/arabinose dehydrogenase